MRHHDAVHRPRIAPLSALAPVVFACLAGGCGRGPGSDGRAGQGDSATQPDGGSDAHDGTHLPDTDHCGALDGFIPLYTDAVATWAAQDDLDPGPAEPLVFTGSSSIRRWEGLLRSYADHRPVQRGIGGAQVAEIAWWADNLVLRHNPRGVVVFAGTNDVAAGVEPEAVVARFRCLRERVWVAFGRDRPVFFIGITPTPARWDQWDRASAVNDAVEALSLDDPGLVYVDVPAGFLSEGAPPPDALFVADGLHLSDAGYALWDAILRAEIDRAIDPWPPLRPAPDAPPTGARLLIDLGPDNTDDGERTPSPDYRGHHWNNWHALEGGAGVLPGEHLSGLRTDTGHRTGVDLVVTGGWLSNGRSNGGLLWPDPDALGDLAVGSATGDFFYALPEDTTGGLALRGLDPAATYRLRLFASRADAETRATRFTVQGATTRSDSVQTSGPGAGASGDGNDDDVVTFDGLQPDPWGHLVIDASIDSGSYGYLSLIELTAEGPAPPPEGRSRPR